MQPLAANAALYLIIILLGSLFCCLERRQKEVRLLRQNNNTLATRLLFAHFKWKAISAWHFSRLFEISSRTELPLSLAAVTTGLQRVRSTHASKKVENKNLQHSISTFKSQNQSTGLRPFACGWPCNRTSKCKALAFVHVSIHPIQPFSVLYVHNTLWFFFLGLPARENFSLAATCSCMHWRHSFRSYFGFSVLWNTWACYWTSTLPPAFSFVYWADVMFICRQRPVTMTSFWYWYSHFVCYVIALRHNCWLEWIKPISLSKSEKINRL